MQLVHPQQYSGLQGVGCVPGIMGAMGMMGTGARSPGFTHSISYTGARSTTTFSRRGLRLRRRRSRERLRERLHGQVEGPQGLEQNAREFERWGG